MANCKDACVKDRDAPPGRGRGRGLRAPAPSCRSKKKSRGALALLRMLDLTTDVYGKRVTTRFAAQVEGVWRQRKLCYK